MSERKTQRQNDDPTKIICRAIEAGDQATIDRVMYQLRTDPLGDIGPGRPRSISRQEWIDNMNA